MYSELPPKKKTNVLVNAKHQIEIPRAITPPILQHPKLKNQSERQSSRNSFIVSPSKGHVDTIKELGAMMGFGTSSVFNKNEPVMPPKESQNFIREKEKIVLPKEPETTRSDTTNRRMAQNPVNSIKSQAVLSNSIESECYIVQDVLADVVILGHNVSVRREVGSITKTMTALVTLNLCDKFNIDPRLELVTILKEDVDVGGTSSRLRSNEVLTVWDLLHGLMLPSGNDAANALCRYFGGQLYNQQNEKSVKSDAMLKNNIILLDPAKTDRVRLNSLSKVSIPKEKEMSKTPSKRQSDADKNNGGDSSERDLNQNNRKHIITKMSSSGQISNAKSKVVNDHIVCSYNPKIDVPTLNDFAMSNNLNISGKESKIKLKSPRHRKKSKSMTKSSEYLCFPHQQKANEKPSINIHMMYFVGAMNKTARQLGLSNSWFDCPHGLSNPKNKTTAFEVCIFSKIAMEDRRFRQIVNTTSYECKSKGGKERSFSWRNRNRFAQGRIFNGIKPGMTPNSGACMSTAFIRENIYWIIVTIKSKNDAGRFSDCLKILKLSLKKCGLFSKQKFDIAPSPPKKITDKKDFNEDNGNNNLLFNGKNKYEETEINKTLGDITEEQDPELIKHQEEIQAGEIFHSDENQ